MKTILALYDSADTEQSDCVEVLRAFVSLGETQRALNAGVWLCPAEVPEDFPREEMFLSDIVIHVSNNVVDASVLALLAALRARSHTYRVVRL